MDNVLQRIADPCFVGATIATDSTVGATVVRNYEFAPIKNETGIDSVESARELCKENGIEL